MTTTAPDKLEDKWLIRPCEMYDIEYKDCITIKARLHQHFIFGHSIDCNIWKRDYDNCDRWEKNQDERSAKELIDSEKKRRKERLEPHYKNTVWERRRQPPENWDAPLPDYIKAEYEQSYLHIKSKEMKGEAPPSKEPMQFCVLM